MKKPILRAYAMAASMLPMASLAQVSDAQHPPPYNVAVHQAVVALLNAQVAAAMATVKGSSGCDYRAETLIAQSLEWPTADLAEAWVTKNPKLTIPQAVKIALVTEIHVRINQLEQDNKYGVIPFPNDDALLLPKGLSPTGIKSPPYQYVTGPFGSWEPYPMALEEAEISILSPK